MFLRASVLLSLYQFKLCFRYWARSRWFCYSIWWTSCTCQANCWTFWTSIFLSKAVAICKCAALTGGDDAVSWGNSHADATSEIVVLHHCNDLMLDEPATETAVSRNVLCVPSKTQVNALHYITGKHCCLYHPQSGGAVERTNGILRKKKTSKNKQRNWPKLGNCLSIRLNVYTRTKQNHWPVSIWSPDVNTWVSSWTHRKCVWPHGPENL